MRHFLAVLVAVTLVASPIYSGVTRADADEKKTKKDAPGTKVSVTGKVSTTKTDVDKFTSIKLTATDGTVYNVTIDDKGKDLATKYEGISVVANGTVTEKDKEKWLTVTSTGDKKKGKK